MCCVDRTRYLTGGTGWHETANQEGGAFSTRTAMSAGKHMAPLPVGRGVAAKKRRIAAAHLEHCTIGRRRGGLARITQSSLASVPRGLYVTLVGLCSRVSVIEHDAGVGRPRPGPIVPVDLSRCARSWQASDCPGPVQRAPGNPGCTRHTALVLPARLCVPRPPWAQSSEKTGLPSNPHLNPSVPHIKFDPGRGPLMRGIKPRKKWGSFFLDHNSCCC